MKRLVPALMVSSTLLLFPAFAEAADFGSLKDTPVAAPAPTWSGFYFGGSGGYGHNRSKNNYDDSDGLSSSISESAEGGLVSAVFGFDRQIRDRFVIGAFADFDWSDFGRGNDAVQNGLTITRAWSVGGRVGYLVTPRALLFATAGFTQAHFRNDGWWDILANGIGPNLPGRPSRNFNGYFLGGGLEVMMGSNFFLRGELRYADYGEETTNAGNFFGTTYVDREDPEIFTARLGVVYKLGRGEHSLGVESLKDGGEGAEHTYKAVTISGVDVARDSYYLYSFNAFALNGDFNRDGFVFRTLGVLGDYSYKDTMVPGTKFEVDDRAGDVMIGYQKVFSRFAATAYIGYEIRDFDVSPRDPTNKLSGTESGFKVAFDLETKDEQKLYVSLDGSYSTAFNSFYGEVRVGYNSGNFIVGPEGSIYSDEGEVAERLGGFLAMPFNLSSTWAGQVTINAGYQFVEGGGGVTSSRGGEGAYAGAALKLAY